MKKIRTVITVLVVMLAVGIVLSACGEAKSSKHKISFIVDNKTYETVRTNGYEIVHLPLIPKKNGYDFSGWYWRNMDIFFESDTLINTELKTDLKLYAEWTETELPPVIQVNFKGFTYDGSDTYSMTVPNKTDKIDFTKVVELSDGIWALNDNDGNKVTSSNAALALGLNTFKVVVTGSAELNKTYTLKVTREEVAYFQITYYANDGTSATFEQQVSEGERFIASGNTTFTRAAYTLERWNTQKLGGGVNYSCGTTITATDDMDLYAVWTPIGYTITYNLNGGTNSGTNKTTYNIETATFTLANATRANYSFGGWFEEADFQTQVTAITKGSYGDIELYAKFTAVAYTITYNLNGGTNDDANPVGYNVETETFTLENATRANYSFGGWFKEADFRTQVTTVTKGTNGDIVLYAKFTAVAYTITYNLNGGTNSGTNKTTYTVETATITLANATRTNYTFGGWFEEADFQTQVTAIAKGSYGDIELYAKFTAVVYAITYNLNGGTNDGTNPASYTTEDAITFGSPERTGYTFGGWFSNSALTTSKNSINAGESGAVTLWAKWTANTYKIYYNSNNGAGTQVSDNATYASTTVTLRAATTFTKTGYSLTSWNTADDGSGIAYSPAYKFSTYNIADDLTLYAVWTANTYTVTLNQNGGTGGQATLSVTFDAAMPSLVSFPARAGWIFMGYFDSAAETGGNQYYTSSGAPLRDYATASDTTLWARWAAGVVILDFNNGTDTRITMSYTPGTATPLFDATAMDAYAPDGKTFGGWFTSDGTEYTEIPEDIGGGVLELFAEWV